MSDHLPVVVTGVGGFVGGYVARWLAARGHAVVGTVRRTMLDTPMPPGVEVRVGDLCAADSLPRQFDALVHCAAEIPARCTDAAELFERNVEAARAVFDRAREAGARAVVFTSSMSVYGRIDAPVVTEDLAPVDVDSYGRSKSEGERLLRAAVDEGLGSALSIRLPGTVGRGSHDNFLSDALVRARAGNTLVGRHADAPFNNIVFVGDLARFIGGWIAAPRPGYSVTNLAARNPISVAAVYEQLFASLGTPARIEYQSGGKPPFLIALERAEALGYAPLTVRDSIAAFVHDSLRDETDPSWVADAAGRL